MPPLLHLAMVEFPYPWVARTYVKVRLETRGRIPAPISRPIPHTAFPYLVQQFSKRFLDIHPEPTTIASENTSRGKGE